MANGRASAPVAIGVVGLVAVIAAAAVVLLAPLATSEDSDRPGHETEVPETLVDGSPLPDAPPQLLDLVDDPVVPADRRDELADGMHCETMHMAGEADTELEAVFVTPTAGHAVLIGEGSFGDAHMDPAAPEEQDADQPNQMEEIRSNCLFQHEGGGWSSSGGGGGTAPDLGPAGDSRGGGSMCCPDGRGIAYADVSVAGDIAWLLQDRGPYWLAYPVDGLDVVTIEWPFPQSVMGGSGQPPRSRVRLVDGDGDVVTEQLVGN